MNTQTLTNADCRSRHTAGNANLIQASNICTFTRAGQGTCMGDSGGKFGYYCRRFSLIA